MPPSRTASSRQTNPKKKKRKTGKPPAAARAGKDRKKTRLPGEIKKSKNPLSRLKKRPVEKGPDAEAPPPQQETVYRLLGEFASDVIWTMDMNLDLTYVSPSITRLQGYSVEEALEGGIQCFLAPESLATAAQVMMEELEIEKQKDKALFRNRTFQVRYLTKDGRRGWAEVKTAFVRDRETRPIGIVGISRDITERKRMEDELRSTNEILVALIQASPLSIVSLDLDGRVTKWNPAAERTFGWKEEEVMGRPNPNLPDDLKDEFLKLRETVVGGATVTDLETRRLNKGGRPIDVSLSMAPLRDARGNIVGLMSVITDIRERKRMEEERERMQTLLLQAQKMEAIGQLAGGLAHDFNNLLTAIQGFSDMSLMSLSEDHPARDEMMEIRKACDHAGNLTRQLMLFGRRQSIRLKTMNLSATIGSMQKMLGRLIGERITIGRESMGGLWNVKADAGCIEQVLMNLVVNARDAMPDGGKVTIRTENAVVDEGRARIESGARAGKFVCLKVEDTGTGMDRAIQPRIFDPFFTTKGPNGTGLGLSVVYGIVKQHGGWIEVDSAPGRGSCFSIFLPACIEKHDEAEKPAESGDDYRGRGERILLVEDEISVKKVFLRMLTEYGFDVFAASTARDAMDLFEREKGRFDLVFSDVVLPDRSGIKLVEELLARKPDLKILISSGYTVEDSDWQVIQTRGHNFLQKPYSFPDLLKVIRRLLEKKG
jgi:two-component system cell cycle sensor histidine kinase/response regulator CckA